MGWVPWLGAPPWPLEPEGTEKSVCGLAWPLAFPCPIGACGKVTSPAGSPSSGYLGTLGGGGPLEGCWAHRIGVLWCGTSKRRARMARAQETVKVSEWAGASHATPLPALHSTSLGFRRRLFFLKTRIEFTGVAHLRGSRQIYSNIHAARRMNISANCRPGCRAMQVYMLSIGGARGGRQPVHKAH